MASPKENSKDFLNKTGAYVSLDQLFRSSPDLINLANHERLCKLRDNFYVICQDYCCGEFWESATPFCCPNNFRPVRNLFFFLLISFIGLFALIIVFLLTESLDYRSVKKIIHELEILWDTPSFESNIIYESKLLSEASSLDEDSSIDGSTTGRTPKTAKALLTKHSKFFRDMSRFKSSKRNLRGKPSI